MCENVQHCHHVPSVVMHVSVSADLFSDLLRDMWGLNVEQLARHHFPHSQMPSIRRVAYTTITIFCIFFFTARIDHQNFAWRSLSTLEGLSLGWVSGSFSLPSEYSTGFPDFSHYHPFHTLSAEQFPIGTLLIIFVSPEANKFGRVDDPNKRVIVVGDIHGMDKSLQCVFSLCYFSISHTSPHQITPRQTIL